MKDFGNDRKVHKRGRCPYKPPKDENTKDKEKDKNNTAKNSCVVTPRFYHPLRSPLNGSIRGPWLKKYLDSRLNSGNNGARHAYVHNERTKEKTKTWIPTKDFGNDKKRSRSP